MLRSRINTLVLPGFQAEPVAPLLQEQYRALQDLLQYSYFQPLNDNNGPYDLNLEIEENRLVIRVCNAEREMLQTLALSLTPYRRLIQDYFLMMESYERARHDHAGFEKMEALDMGRRGLHDEGGNLLRTRLQDKIEMDLETARRLFSLVCLLTRRSPYLV